MLENREAEGYELIDVVYEQAVRSGEPYKTNRARRENTWYLFFKRPVS